MLVKLPGDSKTMAANEAFKDVHRSKNKTLSTILTEDDVPGAFLKGRKPEQLYAILDFSECGLGKMPPNSSCT